MSLVLIEAVQREDKISVEVNFKTTRLKESILD